MTTVSVPHLMKMYYGEVMRNPCNNWNVRLGIRLTSNGVDFVSAERLFPHQEFYKWLAYGNGEKINCTGSIIEDCRNDDSDLYPDDVLN